MRWLDAALAGLRVPVPRDAPSHVRRAVGCWRLTLVALPILLLAIGFGGVSLGRSAMATAAEISSDPMMVLLTLGLVLVFAFLLYLVGGLLIAVGVTAFLLAPLFFVLLSRALARVLRGGSTGVGMSLGVLIPTLLIGASFGVVFVTGFAGDVGVQRLATVLVVLGLAILTAGPCLMLLPRTRRWLKQRHLEHVQRQRKGWAPVQEAPPTFSRFSP